MLPKHTKRASSAGRNTDALTVLTGVLTALHLGWLVWAEAPALNAGVAGILLLVAVWLLSRRQSGSAHPMVAMLALAGGVNLIVGAMAVESPVPGRVLLLIVAAAAVSVGLGTMVAWRPGRNPGPAIVTVAILLTPLLLTEGVLAAGAEPLTAEPSAEYARPPLPGENGAYQPLSMVTVPYPGNVGGYLDLATTIDRSWDLGVSDTIHVARLTRHDDGAVLRVEIDRIGEPVPWGVQLRQTRVPIEQGQSYRLSFRARADGRRTMEVNVNLGREPWSWLGLGQSVTLDSSWQRFDRTFVASGSDSAAWLRFDLGGSTTAVELRDVALAADAPLPGAHPGNVAYSLPYAFDSLGCRGSPRPIQKGGLEVRILSLGDSYTLGAGVRDGDAWPARLEALLDAEGTGTTRGTQVFNCAVTGAGTVDARERFLSIGPTLQPDLVILGLVLGDDSRMADDVTMPIVPSRRIDRVLRFPKWWRHRQAMIQLDAATAVSIPAILEAVASLDSTVRAAGSRLAVVVLQDHASRAWDTLVRAATDSNALPGIPVLSLGDRIRIYSENDRYVLPRIDMHPSRTVHRAVAEATAAFVRAHRLTERLTETDTTQRTNDPR